MTCHVRLMTCEQVPLLRTRSVAGMLTPQQDVNTVGGSKVQPLPHSTVLSGAQEIVRLGAGTGGETTNGTAHA